MEASRLLLTLLACALLSTTAATRPLPNSEASFAARFESGSLIPCWDSLLELRSCTGEIVLFFLNGEMYLGPSCCRSIHYIQQQCWPALLSSLGFTPEETNILRGYCDASASSGAPPPPPPPPGPTDLNGQE